MCIHNTGKYGYEKLCDVLGIQWLLGKYICFCRRFLVSVGISKMTFCESVTQFTECLSTAFIA